MCSDRETHRANLIHNLHQAADALNSAALKIIERYPAGSPTRKHAGECERAAHKINQWIREIVKEAP